MMYPNKALGDLPLEIIDGDRGANYPKTNEFSAHGHCLFLNAGNVSASGFSFSDTAFISEEKDQLLRKGKAQRDDVILTTRGTVGNLALYDESVQYEHVRINSGMVLMRPDKTALDPEFLYYALRSPAFSRQVASLQTGSAQPQLPIRDIKHLKIPFPDLSRQKEVSKRVKLVFDKIELNRRMNETLEEMARAVFRDWFVDFGPTRRQMAMKEKGVATDPTAIMGHAFPPDKAATLAPLFPDKLGDDGLPEGWGIRSIYDVAKVVYGAPFKSKQFNTEGAGRPLARIRDLPKNAAGQFTEEIHKKEYLIQPGDIVVGMDGEFRSYLWHGVPTLMNQRICSFVPIDLSNRAFVWLAIKPLLKFFEDTAIATTVIHLGKGDIDTFSIVDAGREIMAAFSETIEPMASKIVANGQENQTLVEMRDLLLPKLMSGEIRLKDVEASL